MIRQHPKDASRGGLFRVVLKASPPKVKQERTEPVAPSTGALLVGLWIVTAVALLATGLILLLAGENDWARISFDHLWEACAIGAAILILGTAAIVSNYSIMTVDVTLDQAIAGFGTLDKRKAGEGRAALEKFTDWRQDQWRRLARGAGAAAITTVAALVSVVIADGAVSTKTTATGGSAVAQVVRESLPDDVSDSIAEATEAAITAAVDTNADDVANTVWDANKTDHPLAPYLDQAEFQTLVNDAVAGGTTVERTLTESNFANLGPVMALSGFALLIGLIAWSAAIRTQGQYVITIKALGDHLDQIVPSPSSPTHYVLEHRNR